MSFRADTLHMEPTTCRCADRDLLTVRETAGLPVMKHISVPTLYRLIERAEFPVRKVSDRKTLVLVTYFCPAHLVKAPDDIDLWLTSAGLS